MKNDFNDLFTAMDTLKVSNGMYFNMAVFYETLSILGKSEIRVEDLVIVPFYIYNQKVLELYDYTLNIRQVDKPNADNFILKKTGKLSVKDIKPEIEHKLRRCYIEVIKPNQFIKASKLLEFFQYVRNSPEVKENVIHGFNEFMDQNLYFEFY